MGCVVLGCVILGGGCVGVTVTSILDAIGEDPRCASLVGSGSVAAIVVYIFQIEGMDVTGEITEDSG